MTGNNRYAAARWLALPAIALVTFLTGCNGRESDNKRTLSLSLNADAIAYLVTVAQQNAHSENRLVLGHVAVTAFREPDVVRITAGGNAVRSGKPPGRSETYDVAFSVQNHIARARVTATTARNADIKSAPVQQFNEALSRALTTYALKDHSDGGIKAVHVEGKLLAIDVEAPLR